MNTTLYFCMTDLGIISDAWVDEMVVGPQVERIAMPMRERSHTASACRLCADKHAGRKAHGLARRSWKLAAAAKRS